MGSLLFLQHSVDVQALELTTLLLGWLSSEMKISSGQEEYPRSCMHAKSLQSCPPLCNPVAHQASLSMWFSREAYWSGLPCPSPGDLPNPGIEPVSPTSPALAGRFFTTSSPWEAHGTQCLIKFLAHSWCCQRLNECYLSLEKRESYSISQRANKALYMTRLCVSGENRNSPTAPQS